MLVLYILCTGHFSFIFFCLVFLNVFIQNSGLLCLRTIHPYTVYCNLCLYGFFHLCINYLKGGDVMVSPYDVVTCPHMPSRS